MALTRKYEHKEKIQANNKVELAPYMKAYNLKPDGTMEIDIEVTWNEATPTSRNSNSAPPAAQPRRQVRFLSEPYMFQGCFWRAALGLVTGGAMAGVMTYWSYPLKKFVRFPKSTFGVDLGRSCTAGMASECFVNLTWLAAKDSQRAGELQTLMHRCADCLRQTAMNQGLEVRYSLTVNRNQSTLSNNNNGMSSQFVYELSGSGDPPWAPGHSPPGPSAAAPQAAGPSAAGPSALGPLTLGPSE